MTGAGSAGPPAAAPRRGEGHRLYTPEVLAAAVDLARFAPDPALPLTGEARSPSCGSRVAIGIAVDGEGRIARIGLAAHACAIGQASAAVFARHATGLGRAEIAAARDALRRWLSGEGTMPDWPDLAMLAPASAYPGRHGAMLLAWEAALRAFETEGTAGRADGIR